MPMENVLHSQPRGEHHGERQSIAFVVNNYPPKVGGVELHVSALAQELASQGHRVTVVSLDNNAASAMEKGIDVVRLPCTRTVGGVLAFPYPGTRKRLVRLLASRNIDVVSTHTRFFPMSYVGMRAAKSLHIPVIHTEHGSDYVRGVSAFVGLASRVVDWTLGRIVLRGARHVLGISSASVEFVRRLAGRDATVFHNAIDSEFFAEGSQPGGVPQKLVFLGRLVRGKGWERVVSVAEALLAANQDLTVHFIGDGAERQALEDAVARSSYRNRYTVHGFLGATDIRAILRNSVLLNPTELSEGFQTTLLEAVAAGGVVVSTPVAAAVYLREAGAPVRTISAADAEGWIEATNELLNLPIRPIGPALLESMDWRGRGRDFVDIVSRLDTV
ncbi:glycosyltransferase family 4 protein [Arthrobacter koreensis]|uniref:glycosyltransferase family 4 protein n=1 Tax=Arthrobacter koreensis TaxID=199136 RepID=UPI0036DC432C